MAYHWNGEHTGRPDAFDEPEPQGRQPLRPCGTLAAFNRHHYRKETPCEPCVEAKRECDRIRKAANRIRKPRILAPCGTRSAYKRHKRHGEEACEPCKVALRKDQREREARKRAA